MKNKLFILAILVSGVLLIASAQTRTITGKVTDDSGQPLAGVSITVKGSNKGTATDRQGNYKINVEPSDKVLQFSMAGFVTVNEKTGDRRVINVTMQADNTQLNETVVIGYGTKKSHEVNMYYLSAAPSPSYNTNYPISRINNDFNTEGYAGINENGFRNVKNNPLSTFSIDVDNASYSNIRRFINSGSLPPPEAVRIEEMINYFRYDYPDPHGEHPFSVYSELSGCPWNIKHQLLMVGLKVKAWKRHHFPLRILSF